MRSEATWTQKGEVEEEVEAHISIREWVWDLSHKPTLHTPDDAYSTLDINFHHHFKSWFWSFPSQFCLLWKTLQILCNVMYSPWISNEFFLFLVTFVLKNCVRGVPEVTEMRTNARESLILFSGSKTAAMAVLHKAIFTILCKWSQSHSNCNGQKRSHYRHSFLLPYSIS